MKDKVYVQINFSHRSFTTGKTAIISVDRSPTCSELIDTYFKLAKKKLCGKLNLKENEIVVFDWRFLGTGVVFVD